MSYNTTHRRNPPPPASKIPMDPTTHNHLQDPSTTNSSIQNISNHFSRLYLNHKARSFSKPLPPPPTIEAYFQDKSMAISTISDISTTSSLTKSQSQRSRGAKDTGNTNPHYKSIKKELHDEEQEDSIKRAIVISTKIPTKKEECVKGCVNLVSEKQEKSGGDDEVRKLQQGYEVKMQSLSSVGMGRGRRRSFGSSPQAQLVDFFACNGVKVVSADMPPFMQIHAVDVTRKTYDSLEKFTAKTLALTLKKEFDGVYGAAWHCIVGFSFGSFVTHSVGGFLYFSMDKKLYVLLFKTIVQKAHINSKISLTKND